MDSEEKFLTCLCQLPVPVPIACKKCISMFDGKKKMQVLDTGYGTGIQQTLNDFYAVRQRWKIPIPVRPW
jgi:hypothetical protein